MGQKGSCPWQQKNQSGLHRKVKKLIAIGVDHGTGQPLSAWQRREDEVRRRLSSLRCRRHLLRTRVLFVDARFTELVEKSSPADAKLKCGMCAVSPVFREGLLDQLALLVTQPAGPRCTNSPGERLAQVAGTNRV